MKKSLLTIIFKSIFILFAFFSCSDDDHGFIKEVIPEITIPKIEPISPQEFRKNFPGMAVLNSEYNSYGNYLVLLEELTAPQNTTILRSVEVLDISGETIFSKKSNAINTIIDATIDSKNIFTTSVNTFTDIKNQDIVLSKYDLEGNMTNETNVISENLDTVLSNERISITIGVENVFVGVFKNDLSTFLYAFNKETLEEKWVLQVEPEITRTLFGMIGGSYDCFEQVHLQYKVFLDVDKDENIYIGIPVTGVTIGDISISTITIHNAFFGENLFPKSNFNSPTVGSDALVTKVSSEGKRIYSTVIGTNTVDRMRSLRLFDSKIVVIGRSAITSYNDWNPYLAVHDTETGNGIFSQSYTLGGNEILYGIDYDAENNSFYTGGTGGWTQNPSGVSISENSSKVFLKINADTGAIENEITLSNGARQNQVRSVQVINEFLIFAGWENGPGTHSGDSNPSLISADGYIEVIKKD